MQVPIPSTIKDPYYRYKRDKIQISLLPAKGGSTTITNMDTICKQLNIDIKDVRVFYAKSLGNSVTYKKSKFLINAIHNIFALEDVLEKYIAKYVLCKTCGLPELNRGSCNACGCK